MLAIFLDIETSGLNFSKHVPLEIAFRVVDLFSGKEIVSYERIISCSKETFDKANADSLKVNGITFADSQKGVKLEVVSKEIVDIFSKNDLIRGKSVFICQNPSFDRMFFAKIVDCDIQENNLWPYHWFDLASMFFAIHGKQYLKKRNLFSKDLIASYLNLPKENSPHSAIRGVDHLILCYKTLIGWMDSSLD